MEADTQPALSWSFSLGSPPPPKPKKRSVQLAQQREANEKKRQDARLSHRPSRPLRLPFVIPPFRRTAPRKHPFKSSGKFYTPLLHKELCTSIHSYLALKCLPAGLADRLLSLRDMDTSPFVANETDKTRALRLSWEAKYPRPSPTFFEKRGADTRADYGTDRRLRLVFRSLLVLWRHWRYARLPPEAQMDPVTLEPIQKPVFLFDHRAKRTFVFEATTLHRTIRAALTFQLYTVSDPKPPKNPFTNTPFSYGQLTALVPQLQAHGLLSLELVAWRKVSFCMTRYRMYMESWLHMDAQRQELYAPESEDGQEMLLDFVIDCLHDSNRIVSPTIERLIEDAIKWFPEHDMIRRLRGLCLKQVEGEYFGTDVRRGVLNVFRSIYQHRSALWTLVREKREAQSREDGEDAHSETQSD